MTDDEMIDLYDSLQPLLESRLNDADYGDVDDLYFGGELEAAVLSGLQSAARELIAIPMELVLRAAPMYTAGNGLLLYTDAVTRLARITSS